MKMILFKLANYWLLSGNYNLQKSIQKQLNFQIAVEHTIKSSLEIKFPQAENILYSPNSGQHSFSNEFNNLSREKK